MVHIISSPLERDVKYFLKREDCKPFRAFMGGGAEEVDGRWQTIEIMREGKFTIDTLV
jgi:hypothetical protein